MGSSRLVQDQHKVVDQFKEDSKVLSQKLSEVIYNSERMANTTACKLEKWLKEQWKIKNELGRLNRMVDVPIWKTDRVGSRQLAIEITKMMEKAQEKLEQMLPP